MAEGLHGGARYSDEHYDRPAAAWLREQLGKTTLVMQGPMGTQFIEQGGEGVPSATWNIVEPQEVARLHALYRAVGAQVTLTNTFQASAPALERDGVHQPFERVNRAAVVCARQAAAPCVMGSVGPCGLEYDEVGSAKYRAVRAAYRDQAYCLLDAGVSAIMLETFTTIADMRAALDGVLDVAFGMPVFLSAAIDSACCLTGDGASIEDVCDLAQRAKIQGVGVNCCEVTAATDAVARMKAVTSLPLVVRPHAGLPHRNEDGLLTWDENPDAFVRACAAWCDCGVAIVGSCCGSTARTTCALAAYIEERVQ